MFRKLAPSWNMLYTNNPRFTVLLAYDVNRNMWFGKLEIALNAACIWLLRFYVISIEIRSMMYSHLFNIGLKFICNASRFSRCLLCWAKAFQLRQANFLRVLFVFPWLQISLTRHFTFCDLHNWKHQQNHTKMIHPRSSIHDHSAKKEEE